MGDAHVELVRYVFGHVVSMVARSVVGNGGVEDPGVESVPDAGGERILEAARALPDVVDVVLDVERIGAGQLLGVRSITVATLGDIVRRGSQP